MPISAWEYVYTSGFLRWIAFKCAPAGNTISFLPMGYRMNFDLTSSKARCSRLKTPTETQLNRNHRNRAARPQFEASKLCIETYSKYFGYQPEEPQSTSQRSPWLSTIRLRGARSWWVKTSEAGGGWHELLVAARPPGLLPEASFGDVLQPEADERR